MKDDIDIIRDFIDGRHGLDREALSALMRVAEGYKLAAADRDSLRKALDDRWADDLKAWKAIMRATAKERGLPDNKEVVAYYVAEVERLEKTLEGYRKLDREAATHCESIIAMRTRFTGCPPYVGWKGLGLAMTEAFDERDSLRAKLDRAREALGKIAEADVQRPIGKMWRADAKPSKNDKCVHDVWMYEDCAECIACFARTTLSELSADASSQQTQISDEARHGSN